MTSSDALIIANIYVASFLVQYQKVTPIVLAVCYFVYAVAKDFVFKEDD